MQNETKGKWQAAGSANWLTNKMKLAFLISTIFPHCYHQISFLPSWTFAPLVQVKSYSEVCVASFACSSRCPMWWCQQHMPRVPTNVAEHILFRLHVRKTNSLVWFEWHSGTAQIETKRWRIAAYWLRGFACRQRRWLIDYSS